MQENDQSRPIDPAGPLAAASAAIEAPAPAAGEATAGRRGRTRRLIGRRERPVVADVASLPHAGWLLAVCCVAQFMVILDLSIVNVALPSIQDALGFSAPTLQWVVDAYAITFASFLMLGGRAADHFGQRRTFVIALALFAASSLAGGLAPDQSTLIVARGLQGFAGALMAATSLAIITSSFPEGAARNRAIGLWASMNGAGGAAGVVLGGVITEQLSWRWVLLINPPIGIVTALLAWGVVRELRRAPSASFDLLGALTLTAGQVILVYGVVEAGLKGWSSAAALLPIILGIALLALFGVIEERVASNPIIPLARLSKQLRIANTIVLLFSASLFPMWFVSSLYLQQVLGLSPGQTGLTFLPMTVVILIGARNAGKLVGRFGVRAVLAAGLTLMTIGFLLLARIGPSGSAIPQILIPGMLVTAGIALSIVSSTIAATQGAAPGQAGLASGLVNTSRQVGGGLGLAVLITLATQQTTHLIAHGHGVPVALTSGFRLAFLIGAGLCAAAALGTLTLVRSSAPAGGRALRRFVLSFAIVLAAYAGLTFAFARSHGAPLGAYVLRNAYSFASAPSLHPPKIALTEGGEGGAQLAPGYIFTTSFYNLSEPPIEGQSGPLILDDRLQPVWFLPVPERYVAANLSLQHYHGEAVLAWWQGLVTNTGATERGEYVVANRHYQVIARLHAADGWVLTLHSFTISGEDAWVTANKNVAYDLSPFGGAYNGTLIDVAVQEYNLRTGRLLYNWDALKHVPLQDSEAALPTNGFPWDAYHINSIDVLGNGRFLVSLRNTWAAYLVQIKTGKILWELGGRHSSFSFGPQADFQWQHDVALAGSSTVTMFDDHCCQLTSGGKYVEPSAPSRGLELHLDFATHTATLVAQFNHHPAIDAAYMGDAEALAGGDTFVGWGSEPYFTEYGPKGEVLLEGEFPGPDLSYRTMLEPWVGEPLSKPAGAARNSAGATTVFASWNGATQVVAWRVLGARAGAPLAPIATASRSGFETAIAVPGGEQSFQVQALSAGGKVLGSSNVFSAR
ncbi:MAG TPA: MFS transporter [Solirubrobacteraceae bacterium]|nr:MFS transporter [Solirubrobacteraceae bacterium]